MSDRFIESDRWMAIFNPLKTSHLESWQRGEVEDIPDHLKEPDVIYYDTSTLSCIPTYMKHTFLEKELYFLKNTDLYTLNLIQKKSFKHGYPPSSGALLMFALEYYRILNHRRKETVNLKPYYKHHRSILLFINKGEQTYKGIDRFLSENRGKRLSILTEEIWFDYIKDLEMSVKEGIVYLLIAELSNKNFQTHSGRIARDIIVKLSKDTVTLMKKFKPYGPLPLDFLKGFMEEFSKLPGWMIDYGYQMSRLDIIEKDIILLKTLFPLSLKFEVEHRGFIRILFPSDSKSASNTGGAMLRGSDNIKRLSETSMRKLELLLERERERINTLQGSKINNARIGIEIPAKRGKIFKKLKETPLPAIHFIMLLDISSSVKKGNHIQFLLGVFNLVKDSLENSGIPFTFLLFNDNVYTAENIKEKNIVSFIKGKTNVEKAIREAVSCARKLSKNTKSIILIFTDGEPTTGLKGIALRDFIRMQKRLVPIIGIGLKGVSKVRFYFEETGLEIEDLSRLPFLLVNTIEKQIRRSTPLSV